MRKLTVKLLSGFAALALLAAACAPAATPTAAPQPTAAPFRIGLVTDVGEVDDKSFNQSAWEGAQEGAKAVGGTAEYIETKDAKDYAANIATFADQGFDVIVTVGFALGQATDEAAAKYPNTKFIGVDQFQAWAIDSDTANDIPNVAGLIFPEDQAGYLAGILAAKKSQSGTIAAVLGTDLVPPVVAFGEGFKFGAQATNPDINVLVTYHPGGLDVAFTDPEWGATTAKQAMDQGADVIFGAGGKTGNGALIEVATRAKEAPNSVFCIGVDADQWETVPEAHPCLITSAMKLITPGVVELIQAAKAGSFPGGNYLGDVGLAPYHDFDSQVPADVKTLIADTAKKLESGELKTGYQP